MPTSDFLTSERIPLEHRLRYAATLQRSRGALGDIARELLKGYPVSRQPRSPKAKLPREPVGTALSNRIDGLIGIKAGDGCNCKDLAEKMNVWGIVGCEKKRSVIVSALLDNSNVLKVSLTKCAIAYTRSEGFFASCATAKKLFTDWRNDKDMEVETLKLGANWLLDKAIEDSRGMVSPVVLQAKHEAQAARHRERRARVPQNQPKPRTAITRGDLSKHLSSLKKEQDRLFAINQQQPAPARDEFHGEPILHFGAHLWPVKGNWQWHANLWNHMPRLINGQCFVGVAISPETDSIDAVRAALHPSFVVKDFANTSEGENHTFRWLQDVVPRGQDDVLIYCHAKGVRAHTAASESVRRWSEAMYQTVVFNHDMIREKLAAGYKNVHSFRTFGKRPLSPMHRWHPSGTFFAVRAKHLNCETSQCRPVKARYGGVEAWCGDHFKASDSWCEFFDNSMFTTLYDHKASIEQVAPALIEWNRLQRYER